MNKPEDFDLVEGVDVNFTPEEQALFQQIAEHNSRAIEIALQTGEPLEFFDMAKVTKAEDPVMRDLVTKIFHAVETKGMK